jgi:hypothetical protein
MKDGLVTVLDMRTEDEFAAGHLPRPATATRRRAACARNGRGRQDARHRSITRWTTTDAQADGDTNEGHAGLAATVPRALADGQAAVFEPGLNSLPLAERYPGLSGQVEELVKRHVLPHSLVHELGKVLGRCCPSQSVEQNAASIEVACQLRAALAGSPGD